MSIWDGDRNPPNIPMKTGGGKVFWEVLEKRGSYRLQKKHAV